MRKSALYCFGLVAASLVALGLIVLCSASQPNSIKWHHGNAFGFFLRQLMFVGIGFVVAAIVAKVDYRIWKDYRVLTWILYGFVFVLLCAVFPPIGHKVNGAYRWIPVGPINIQPSEFAKLAIVITVAMWMDYLGWKSERFRAGALVPLALIGVYSVPILAETDLGSTMVVAAAGALMMLLGGTRIVYLCGVAAVGLAGIGGVLVTNPNRMRRLAAWLPSFVCDWLGMEPAVETSNLSEMTAAKYQVYNSLIAIKNGGLWGVGLGQSMQKQAYLPEAHTDFVMAVGAEELGIVFSLAVIVLFFTLFFLAIYIGKNASDRFGRYLAIGMGFIIFFQAMFNLGVISEALPTKGMALPFFSYGGTNMISACIAVGVILSVGIHSYQDKKRTLRHNVYFRA